MNGREITETPYPNAVPMHLCVIHRLQDGRNGSFSILVHQLTEPLGDELNEV